MGVSKRQIARIPYYRSALFHDVKDQIDDADLLLWLPSGPYGLAIRAVSGGVHSHAGIAAWLTLPSGNRDLVSLDTREHAGGSCRRLEVLVAKYPGMIAWYKTNHIGLQYFNAKAVVDAFWMNVLGDDYGRWNAFKLALQKMFFLRFLVQPNHDDKAVSPLPDVCSGAVSHWMREAGGVDPVMGLADESTWPSHLENSFFFEYKCHLIPSSSPQAAESVG